MRIVTLLDTAAGSLNKGDEIIMDSARRGLSGVLKDDFVINIPSHLACFPPRQSKGSGRMQAVADSELKFACGTDMFWTNMWKRRNPAFNINLLNYKPFVGTIFLGVGYSDKKFTMDMNYYTRELWNRVLSHEYVHSTRDDLTKDYLEKMGFQAVNTGCPTLWGFTPEFCSEIPTTKAQDVVTTISNHTNRAEDNAMLALLKSEYRTVSLWLQGRKDHGYVATLAESEGVELIAPDTFGYRDFLRTHEVDYVGPRLHAGVFAMQQKRRSIILSVDHRAIDFATSFNIPCMPRADIETIKNTIESEYKTEIKMDYNKINAWLGQFA